MHGWNGHVEHITGDRLVKKIHIGAVEGTRRRGNEC